MQLVEALGGLRLLSSTPLGSSWVNNGHLQGLWEGVFLVLCKVGVRIIAGILASVGVAFLHRSQISFQINQNDRASMGTRSQVFLGA